ncbi:ribose-5-phosphate isomerase [Arthrobacter oryzae]|uniref:Ribose-5-phosphate isomerase B n=1 Tax=Arthrobacter oryzae TaxID=409290 RepID=A0A3N0CE71_9MICC|nr:ribose-5-phosphate isomerase [Arthrobacter oryzae]RNL61742.1 ribose-5-phosphate isomerase [Arthrobacter oryzae]
MITERSSANGRGAGTTYRIHIGADHSGLELSRTLQHELAALGFDVVDHGPAACDAQDDYPAFCISAAESVARDINDNRHSLGIVIGGSGNGEQIAANKVRGIRAALVWNESTARVARQHNDANVIALGAREHTPEECLKLAVLFLQEPFTQDSRHKRRIAQIADYETCLTPLACETSRRDALARMDRTGE